MKAAVYHGNQDVRIEDVPEPSSIGPHDLLLEVVRGAICGTDVGEYFHGPIVMSFNHPASPHEGPVIIGHEFVGRVIEVGSAVEKFQVGQRVVPGAGVWCGECEWCLAGRPNICSKYYTLGFHDNGGLAQLARVPEMMCFSVAEACTDDSAATTQPVAVAMHAVHRSKVQIGDVLVVLGVGAIGSLIVAAAVAEGHKSIIAIDIVPERLDVARTLGAAHLINASETNPVEAVLDLTNGKGADVVIESSGAEGTPQQTVEMVKRGGRILIVGLQAKWPKINLHDIAMRELEIQTTIAHVCHSDIPRALKLVADNHLPSIIIDRVIPLDALVDEGFRAFQDGNVKGKIIVDTQA